MKKGQRRETLQWGAARLHANSEGTERRQDPRGGKGERVEAAGAAGAGVGARPAGKVLDKDAARGAANSEATERRQDPRAGKGEGAAERRRTQKKAE